MKIKSKVCNQEYFMRKHLDIIANAKKKQVIAKLEINMKL